MSLPFIATFSMCSAVDLENEAFLSVIPNKADVKRRVRSCHSCSLNRAGPQTGGAVKAVQNLDQEVT